MIQNETQLLEHLSATSREQAKKHVYKYTNCGAWINFDEGSILLGSIVEGADFGTNTYRLSYPFSPEDYQARIDAIEAEASAIWDWANEEDEATGMTPAEAGCDAPDVGFEYQHLNPEGISS